MWTKIKAIVESGDLGKVMTIQHNENIGHYHMSHSYVRGEWRDSKTSAPIALSKSCHDFDIITWLVDSRCSHIGSFGDLSFFNETNAPKGASKRCLDCKLKTTCEYSAERVYTQEGGHSPAFFTNNNYSKTAIKDALKKSNYGQCVFYSNNNVCDHQSTILNFENGVTATFNLNAFTRKTSRTVKIMCEKGEIRSNGQDIEVILFKLRNFSFGDIGTYIVARILDGLRLNKSIRKKIRCNPRWGIKHLIYGHGGADYHFISEVIKDLKSKNTSKSSISKSVESHVMAFAAETSRLEKRTVNIEEFKNEFLQNHKI